MRSVLFGLLLLCGQSYAQCPPSQAPGRAPPAANVPQNAVAASVRVDMAGGFGGSGTHVGNGCFITNRHVTGYDTGKAGSVTFPTGHSYSVTVSAVCDYADMACLTTNDVRDEPYVSLAAAATPRGGEVYQAGYPASNGRRLHTKHGTMIGEVKVEWGRSDDIAMTCSSGDSGSGIFNSRGELCGVLWGGQPGRNVTTACTYVDTARFVNECCRKRPPPVQPPPPVSPAPPSDAQLQAILAQLAKMEAAIAAIQSTPGPAGKDGKQGPAGPQGPPGASADVSVLIARIAALEAAIATLRGKETVTIPGTNPPQ
jgi:hypothetical protein